MRIFDTSYWLIWIVTTMICVAAVIYVVRRFDCVRDSITTIASIHKPTPLVGLVEPLVGGPILQLMRRCSITLLPGFRLSTSFKINDVYQPWVILIFIIAGP
jgi:hypothetical protein